MSDEIITIKEIAVIQYNALKIIIYYDGNTGIYKHVVIQVNKPNEDTAPDILAFDKAEKAGSFIASMCPFIDAELTENIKKYHGLTLHEVLKVASITDAGKGKTDFLRFEHDTDLAAEVYAAAYKKYRAARAGKAQEQRKQEILSTAEGQNAQKLTYTAADDTTFIRRDSLIDAFFNLSPDVSAEDNKLVLNDAVYKFSRHHKNFDLRPVISQSVPFIVSTAAKFGAVDPADFEGTNLIPFDPGFDYFVMLMCDQLYEEGNREVTPTYFLKRMSIPYSDAAVKKLLFTLIKGASTQLDINNINMLEFLGVDEDKRKAIIGAALPIVIKYDPKKYRGNLSNMTIRINDYTPFRQVADPVRHLETFDKELLTLYEGNRNDKYWRLLHYLYVHIAWLRNDNTKGKKRDNCFLMSTIWAELGDVTTHQRAATRKMFLDILEQCFIRRDYIYKVVADPEDSDKYYLLYHKERKPGINAGKRDLVPELPDKRKYQKKEDKS